MTSSVGVPFSRPVKGCAHVFSLFLAFVLPVGLCAQRSDAELPFVARTMGLTLDLPSLDGLRYDTLATGEGYGRQHLRWTGDRGRFELRYSFEPDSLGQAMPHVLAGLRLAQLMHHEEDGLEDYVGRWRGGREDLDRLGADWVYFFDFRPTGQVGEWQRAYLAAYYREGVGSVYALLLYNDPAYLHSDWVYVLPFAKAPEEER